MPTAGAPIAAKTPEGAEQSAGNGTKRKKVLAIVVVIALLGGGYWMFLRPAKETAPKPGEVLTLEPITVNLAGGRYLKIGLALQLVEGVKEVEGSKALDATIELFSDRNLDEVSAPERREELQQELTTRLEALYPDEVIGSYFVVYVTQ